MSMHNRRQSHLDNYEGEIITTSGKPSVNAGLEDMRIYGKTTQVQTVQSKNLLDLSKYNNTSALSVKFEFEPAEKKTRVYGTPTSDYTSTYINFSSAKILGTPIIQGNTYIFSFWCSLAGRYSRVYLVVEYADSSTAEIDVGIPFTATQNGIIKLIGNSEIIFNLGTNYDYYVWFQLEPGSTATAWVPFVPNSPSPPYPSPLNNVPSAIDITRCGQNLYDKTVQFDAKGWTGTIFPNMYNKYVGDVLEVYTNGYLSYSVGQRFKCPANTTMTCSVNFMWLYPGSEYCALRIARYNAETAAWVTYVSVFSSTIPGLKTYTFTTDNYTELAVVASVVNNTAPGGTKLAEMRDIAINIGSLATHTPYNGTTTAIAVKDVNNNAHELCSLPDGTRDEGDYDSGKIIKRVKTLIVTSATNPTAVNYYYSSWMGGLCNIYWWDSSIAWGANTGVSPNVYSNIAVGRTPPTTQGYSCSLGKYSTYSGIDLYMKQTNLTDLGFTLDNAGAQAWVNAQIAAHGNIIFMYEYATPQIYDLHPDEAAKLKALKSVYPLTNIFTDAQPTLNCRVRKLGNRPYIEAPLIDEGGNFITDENGDNIAGLF